MVVEVVGMDEIVQELWAREVAPAKFLRNRSHLGNMHGKITPQRNLKRD
jgi:hypothetical protein